MNTYRVDRANSLTVPVGMNSILYIGDSAEEATAVYQHAEPGKDAWNQPNATYGVIMSVWNPEAMEYRVKRSKGLNNRQGGNHTMTDKATKQVGMSQIKTSELQGSALDWAVAKCEWVEWTFETATTEEIIHDCHYSTDWAQGGPIIDRMWPEFIEIAGGVRAIKPNNGNDAFFGEGPTYLIAAMRCYVASKLGDEVEVPDELL